LAGISDPQTINMIVHNLVRTGVMEVEGRLLELPDRDEAQVVR